MASNDGQIEYWNGTAGNSWVAMQESMDRLLAPFSAQAIAAAAVQPGEHVLDVGCGCGATSLALADAGARVTGVDISAPMLARARERAQGRPELQFIERDASLPGMEPVHDLLFSRFGVMFFADPADAFTQLAGALRPGGRLCFICWQASAVNPWIAVPGRAAQPFMPPPASPPDPLAPGPFAFADPERVRSILGAAGFGDVRIDPAAAAMKIGATLDAAVNFVLDIGPMRTALLGLADDVREQALDGIRAALAPHVGADGVALDGNCWIVRARRA